MGFIESLADNKLFNDPRIIEEFQEIKRKLRASKKQDRVYHVNKLTAWRNSNNVTEREVKEYMRFTRMVDSNIKHDDKE